MPGRHSGPVASHIGRLVVYHNVPPRLSSGLVSFLANVVMVRFFLVNFVSACFYLLVSSWVISFRLGVKASQNMYIQREEPFRSRRFIPPPLSSRYRYVFPPCMSAPAHRPYRFLEYVCRRQQQSRWSIRSPFPAGFAPRFLCHFRLRRRCRFRRRHRRHRRCRCRRRRRRHRLHQRHQLKWRDRSERRRRDRRGDGGEIDGETEERSTERRRRDRRRGRSPAAGNASSATAQITESR